MQWANSNMTSFHKLQSFGFSEPFAEYLCNRKAGTAAALRSAFPVLSELISEPLIANGQRSDGQGIALWLQTLGAHSVWQAGLVMLQALAQGITKRLIAFSR